MGGLPLFRASVQQSSFGSRPKGLPDPADRVTGNRPAYLISLPDEEGSWGM
jgi:hypothetical protein